MPAPFDRILGLLAQAAWIAAARSDSLTIQPEHIHKALHQVPAASMKIPNPWPPSGLRPRPSRTSGPAHLFAADPRSQFESNPRPDHAKPALIPANYHEKIPRDCRDGQQENKK